MISCPNCSSNLFSPQTNGCEDFYTCMMCAREWDKDLNPIRDTELCRELVRVRGVYADKFLTKKKDCDKIEV